MLSPGEELILKKIAELSLATKAELNKFLKESNKGNPSIILDSVTKSLLDKELIAKITPIGSTCFVITRRGSRILGSLK